MRGAVSADGSEAVLSIEVLSPEGASSLQVEATVDTGFTGLLTLPPASVEAIGLQIVGSAGSVLADGSVVMEDVCVASVLWHGGERAVRVLVADAAPLLGMALLRGSELQVRVEGNGEVAVEELYSHAACGLAARLETCEEWLRKGTQAY